MEIESTLQTVRPGIAIAERDKPKPGFDEFEDGRRIVFGMVHEFMTGGKVA